LPAAILMVKDGGGSVADFDAGGVSKVREAAAPRRVCASQGNSAALRDIDLA
jgi:hypothetical protein